MNSVQALERSSRLNEPRRAERAITPDGAASSDLYEEVLSPTRGGRKSIATEPKDRTRLAGAAIDQMMTFWAMSSTPMRDELRMVTPKIEPLDQVEIVPRRVTFVPHEGYLALVEQWPPLFDSPNDAMRSVDVTSPWEAVQRDLIELQIEWEGTPHTPPSEQALRDLDTVISVLPLNGVMPDVEIDDGNGEITLAWRNLEANKFISLVIPGDQSVMFLAQLDDPIVERILLTSGGDLHLFKHFQSDAVVRFL